MINGGPRRLLELLGRTDIEQTRAARGEITELESRIAAVDTVLTEKFPDYATLAAPRPLSVTATQALLGADEALRLMINMPPFEHGRMLSPGSSPKRGCAGTGMLSSACALAFPRAFFVRGNARQKALENPEKLTSRK